MKGAILPYQARQRRFRLRAMERFRGYLAAAIVGAAVGGAAVAVATEALPRLTQRMTGVMAEEMKRRGFSPEA